jgi:hypothetical protein
MVIHPLLFLHFAPSDPEYPDIQNLFVHLQEGYYQQNAEKEVDELPWEKEDRTEEDIQKLKDIASEVKAPEEEIYPKPVNKMRGWHLMKEYVDDDHNVFSKGAFVKNDPDKIPTSKKA